MEKNKYIYNKHGSEHPDGPKHTIHPDKLYIEDLDLEVHLDMDDPQDIFNETPSETDTVELESETDTQEGSESKDSVRSVDASE